MVKKKSGKGGLKKVEGKKKVRRKNGGRCHRRHEKFGWRLFANYFSARRQPGCYGFT